VGVFVQLWLQRTGSGSRGGGRGIAVERIGALECTIRHRMSFLLAQDVGHMNCNEEEECISPRSRLAAASSCEHGSCTIFVLHLSSRKAFCHSFHVPLE
jgi:hypothetical protein